MGYWEHFGPAISRNHHSTIFLLIFAGGYGIKFAIRTNIWPKFAARGQLEAKTAIFRPKDVMLMEGRRGKHPGSSFLVELDVVAGIEVQRYLYRKN